MFFSEDFLMVKPGGLGIFCKHLNKKQIQACDIPAACEQIMNPPQPIALRTSAGLMIGVVKIHDARYDLFVHDVTSLESAVKRATLDTAHGGGGAGGKQGNVMSANGANARVETITVQHQPGQGFAPNLDLEQASWEKFLRGYGQQCAPSIGLGASQEETGEESLDDSGTARVARVPVPVLLSLNKPETSTTSHDTNVTEVAHSCFHLASANDKETTKLSTSTKTLSLPTSAKEMEESRIRRLCLLLGSGYERVKERIVCCALERAVGSGEVVFCLLLGEE
ncbi:hypothetical protein QFC22_005252 [Naganishia vaughanmartiniae]|uniref:Uncharacterized protein n=1 Tax=Naganishia vaughanmartiniae TaxID=1424756 RepID=A0ACC2WUQ5_9TREE|nr:hypothetical protein QFC22_005252 [Naganishia vaughanmartiniae]